MRRSSLYLAAVSAACVGLGVAIAAYSGAFSPNTDVDFGPAKPTVQLLLPDAKTKEARRLRTPDDNGGAVDQVELADGYTREVFYIDVRANRRSKEVTYFPADKKAGEERGPVSNLRIFAVSGLGIASETDYDRSGKVLKSGKLTEVVDGDKKYLRFAIDVFNPQGARLETLLNNMSGGTIGRSTYRADGTAESTKSYGSPGSETYFSVKNFAADGKTLATEEFRSYGSFKVRVYAADGKTIISDSEVTPGTSEVTNFDAQGRALIKVRISPRYGMTIRTFDKDGKPVLERDFSVVDQKDKDGKVVYDPKVKPVYRLHRVTELNAEGKPINRYQWDDKGLLYDVELHKSPTRQTRVDYGFDNGKPRYMSFFDKDDKSVKRVEKPDASTLPPTGKIDKAWFVAPTTFPDVPASKVDVSLEVSHGPG